MSTHIQNNMFPLNQSFQPWHLLSSAWMAASVGQKHFTISGSGWTIDVDIFTNQIFPKAWKLNTTKTWVTSQHNPQSIISEQTTRCFNIHTGEPRSRQCGDMPFEILIYVRHLLLLMGKIETQLFHRCLILTVANTICRGKKQKTESTKSIVILDEHRVMSHELNKQLHDVYTDHFLCQYLFSKKSYGFPESESPRGPRALSCC